MQTKIILASIFLASLLLFSSAVFADIYVRPAKLGIVRLTIQPLFPTNYQGTFDIGNTYNFSLNVSLKPSQNVSSILTLSDMSSPFQRYQSVILINQGAGGGRWAKLPAHPPPSPTY